MLFPAKSKWFLTIPRKKSKPFPRTYKTLTWSSPLYWFHLLEPPLNHSLMNIIAFGNCKNKYGTFSLTQSLCVYYSIFPCHLAFLDPSILQVLVEISSFPRSHPPYSITQNHSISFIALIYSIFIWVICFIIFLFLTLKHNCTMAGILFVLLIMLPRMWETVFNTYIMLNK